MKHIPKTPKWTLQDGYKRGILLPFGSKGYAGIQVQLTQIAGGEKVDNHFHLKQTEFIYFLKGSCDFIFKNTTVTMRPGDLLVIEPGEIHSATNSSKITSEFLTLKLNGSPNDTVWK
jgi:quercetin dioxygenase-like cupin family protein